LPQNDIGSLGITCRNGIPYENPVVLRIYYEKTCSVAENAIRAIETQATDNRKTTQGEIKMNKYVEDLIRNKDFREKIKLLIKKHRKFTSGDYNNWTDKEKQEHDEMNIKIGEILDEYEILRKKCKKLFRNDYTKMSEWISEVYLLDSEQINYIQSLFDDRFKDISDFFKSSADFDMCKIYDFYDDELHPFNKGEEIIHLNGRKKAFLHAYPVAISIHPKASKRDVLDFIEKRWNWIENNYLRSYSDKKLKYGRRKHSQKVLDFLWENKSLYQKKYKVV
jgi:hypothetical protein